MLHDLGWLKQVKLKDSTGTVINPATIEKLDELKTALQNIYNAVDDLEVTTDNISIDAGQINLNTDELETKLQSVLDQLDVALSTRASEATQLQVKTVLDNIKTAIDSINTAIDVDLSTLATESTLSALKDAVDTVETKLQTIIDNLDVELSTRASEATVTEIKETIGQESGVTVLSRLKDLYDKLVAGISVTLEKIKIWDGTNTAEVTDTGRLKVDARIGGGGEQSASISAFGLLKIAQEAMLANIRWTTNVLTNEYTKNITASGAWSIVDTSCLQLNSGAASSSGIDILSNKRYHYQAGRGQIFKISIILGDSGVEGNTREWGLKYGNNGVFIRLDGTQYKLIILNNGIETPIPASTWDIPVTPDNKGHLWYIQYQWLGIGDFFVYYDGALVHTHHYLGTGTKVSMETPDLSVHLKNYNTTNTTNVYLKSGCSSVISEGANIISGLDDDNIIREARVTPTGRLLVSQEPPTAPPETTAIKRTEYLSVAGQYDNEYLIPNGEILVLQKFSASAEVEPTDGTAIELWYDPNGNGISMQIIDAIFASGNSDQHDLNDQFTGDGTAKIRMRIRRLSGGSKDVFCRWEGYY